MAEVLLFTVEDVFELSARLGPILVPGVPLRSELSHLRIGQSLRLVTPTGRRIGTTLAAMERINYGHRTPPENPTIPIAVANNVAKADIEIGTRVFLVKD